MNYPEILRGLGYEEYDAFDFYREIFPEGELDDANAMSKGKYTAIAVEIEHLAKPVSGSDGKVKKVVSRRYTMTDDLDLLFDLEKSPNFCIMAPISYAGKTRKSQFARNMYALCVELDNLKVDKLGWHEGLSELIKQWSMEKPWIPCPTFLVCSGNGLHLYFVFEKAIPLFPNVVKSLETYKRELTTMIWNRHVTTDYTEDKVQQESIFQAFRMPGTLTKSGEVTRVFKVGEKVSVAYMNSFVVSRPNKKNCGIVEVYKSALTLADAQSKYPEWYHERIELNRPKKKWDIKGKVHGDDPYALYRWWKRMIEADAIVGHRYYCLMCLAIYAIKNDVDEETLEHDMWELFPILRARGDEVHGEFTEEDVMDALQVYHDEGLYTYPLTSIRNRSGIQVEKNKRNGRKQEDHMKIARAACEVDHPDGEWINKEGAPKKITTVREWRKAHPEGKKAECARDTGLSRNTVTKWWNEDDEAKADAKKSRSNEVVEIEFSEDETQILKSFDDIPISMIELMAMRGKLTGIGKMTNEEFITCLKKYRSLKNS